MSAKRAAYRSVDRIVDVNVEVATDNYLAAVCSDDLEQLSDLLVEPFRRRVACRSIDDDVDDQRRSRPQ